jgi:putative SOS response-associated peptidase YedK
MCGRIALTEQMPWRDFVSILRVFDDGAPFEPRYNIAPSQPIRVVRREGPGEPVRLARARWGLVPSWAEDASSFGARAFDARSETASTKPMFRAAFRRRRCLVPMSGFYEWRERTDGKQPYYIGRADGHVLGAAGLWERWVGDDGRVVESAAILTTEANELVGELHDRMPVILDPTDFEAWLDPRSEVGTLEGLLAPFDSAKMRAHPVDRRVGDWRHDDPSLVEPIEVAPEPRNLSLF